MSKCCRTCGAELCDRCSAPLIDGRCDACVQRCRRCGGRVEVDDLDQLHDGICEECIDAAQQRDQARVRRDEAMRRLEAWAVHDGSRRQMAEYLAASLLQRCGRPGQADRERWVFVWEASGDRKALRKIVEKLLPVWAAAGITVAEPPVPIGAPNEAP